MAGRSLVLPVPERDHGIYFGATYWYLITYGLTIASGKLLAQTLRWPRACEVKLARICEETTKANPGQMVSTGKRRPVNLEIPEPKNQ